ncbi:FERM and PDZ domain-containing protein 2 isoform X2 [Sphaerodactylus townsendi]|uniref:FERM and PDZ domain-containing protein 2 isoform X2 n=1 Tax=Sphaerodactylus townsendi TaxID=933632 RepID=UPI002026D856|nr:FERM and PDZ domain-containing protein 2 isoform X2 [Sphaerodactylus townsendi]
MPDWKSSPLPRETERMSYEEMNTSVTLAKALQAKGSPLEEEEIWALLFLATECLLEDLGKESSIVVISPWSVVLSAEGTLSFRDNVPQADVAPFRAPEKFCEDSKSKQHGLTKMLVYSLGMTLYWSADYRVPLSQSLQLSDQLHTLLLALCEDLAHRRPSPESILEACKAHQQQSPVQDPASIFIRSLVQCALGSIKEGEEGVHEDDILVPLSRSDAIRKRLLEKAAETSASTLNLDQGRIPQPQQPWNSNCSESKVPSTCKLLINRSASAMDGIPSGGQKNSSDRFPGLGSSSTCSLFQKDSLPPPAPSRHLFQRKEKLVGPEFIVLSSEPPVALQLPGSITIKKGKSFLAQRDVNVILLNGQCLEVKCDIKTKARVVFETVVAYANLTEPFYFSLAYMRGKEFFFLDDDTKLCKVAPEGWSDQPKKKMSIINFTLFLRIKFFVDDFRIIRQGLTRHQFYLQLRKDLLEERLLCSDEIMLRLGALALQAEMGSCAPKTRYRVEDYIPASQVEKMGLEHIQRELAKLHWVTQSLSEGDQAELEFLKVTQQLPEYGVVFYHVFPEKKVAGGGLVLGICTKGIIVYEIRNNARIASRQFRWRETERISAHRKKFMIETSFSGKKHTFLTDSAKTCKYLLDLCSAQHAFSAQMNSQQLLQGSSDTRFMEIARSNSAYAPQQDNLTLIQRLSRSENVLFGTNLESLSSGFTSKYCDDNLSTEASTENGEKNNLARASQSEPHINLSEKRNSYDYLSIDSIQNTANAPSLPGHPRKLSLTTLEREIICVTLKRDPRNGFGFVIIGGENVGKLDLGIFIASIVPGGPADRAGLMKPGGRLISVNSISLEGVSFSTAVKIIQNSSDEVELIISQPKDSFEEAPVEEKRLPSPVSSSRGSESCSVDCERPISETCCATPTPEEECSADGELKTVTLQNSASRFESKISALSADHLESQARGSTSQLHEESSVKSVTTCGSADKDGKIKKEACRSEVDGTSLQGLAPKKAGQVLGRQIRVPTELNPGNSTSKEGRVSLSLAGGCPKSCFFARDENTFEVQLEKNSGGLGFSFVQMETDACKGLGRSFIRIKRLFPGQPAKENGSIEVGDVLLAVNGKSLQGLLYQEVLHLLRGAPPEVTLRLCRPPKGILPEMDQNALTPIPSPVKESLPSLEPSGLGLDCTSTEKESSFLVPDSPRPGCDQDLVEEGPSPCTEQDTVSSPTASLIQFSYKHLWKTCQEAANTETFLSLEEEMRQGCYSHCELERAQSPLSDDLPTENGRPEIHSPTQVAEEYLSASSASITSLLHGGESEAGTMAEPPRLGPSPPAVLDRELCTSESEWDDLEDAEEPQNTREIELCVTLTRSANKGYGFTVVLNKVDKILYISEILGEPALSDGRLRRGDRVLMVNGTDARVLSAEETLALLYSSPRELSLVVGRTTTEIFPTFRPEEVPEIILTKGDFGQLGLKLTGGVGSQLQGISVLEIVPGLPASQEGSLQPHDQIICICGQWTEGMTLDDAVRVCEAASHYVHIRATRNGEPVIPLRTRPSPETVDVMAPPSNETVNLQDLPLPHKQTKILELDAFTPEQSLSQSAVEESYSYSPLQDCIINIELEKPANSSLGFALVGGKNGRAILIKAISPRSSADRDGRLRVGDILLKVNGHLVSGLTRNTVIDILRKTHGLVQLTVCRSAALQWASVHSQWDESPVQNESTQLDGCGGMGVIGSQMDFSLEESSQMNSQESDDRNASPHQPGCVESLQKNEKQRLEPCESEDDIIAQRLSAMPRGLNLVTEEQLAQLAQIKPVPRRNGLQQHLEHHVHSLQKQIKHQETLKEFIDLEHIRPAGDCLVGKAPENQEKNRYRDILPYDETRVPIGEMKGYINASYIQVRVGQEELFYISTQGPLPCTMNDFWQMVWENHSDVIAMITRETERGTTKCHRYWPEPPHTFLDLLRFQLRLDNYQILDCFIIRIIEMTSKRTQEKRQVQHLQFTSWPDHGTPRSSQHLIKFVRFLRKVHTSGPIIAHCSAGVGRSGVLLCVDILLNYIENDMPFDIKQIVRDLRLQRFGMVQTKEQYMFCYELALDVLKNNLIRNSQLQTSA